MVRNTHQDDKLTPHEDRHHLEAVWWEAMWRAHERSVLPLELAWKSTVRVRAAWDVAQLEQWQPSFHKAVAFFPSTIKPGNSGIHQQCQHSEEHRKIRRSRSSLATSWGQGKHWLHQAAWKINKIIIIKNARRGLLLGSSCQEKPGFRLIRKGGSLQKDEDVEERTGCRMEAFSHNSFIKKLL